MLKNFQQLMLSVVVAGGVGTSLSVHRNDRPVGRIDPPAEPIQFTGLPREPVVPAEPPDGVREAEQRRRAVRPPGDPQRDNGWRYEEVLNGGGTRPIPHAAEPLPPTYCHSIERVPKSEEPRCGPRGVTVGSRDIDRVELVSLLTDDVPSAYVLDEMATPPLARQAKRRPLDEFERLGLNAVRLGEELVWTREAPTRMFGAIRAREDCLPCHANARQGDLLGAFTYYLKGPVDRVRSVWER